MPFNRKRRGVTDWLLRYLRRRGEKSDGAKWSVTDLALASGVARATIQRWLAEDGDADPDLVAKVARVLGSWPEGYSKLQLAETLTPPYLGSTGGESQLSDRDLFWLLVHRPDEAAATLQRWQTGGMSAANILLFLEDAETIVREKHGVNLSKFIAGLRADVESRRQP